MDSIPNIKEQTVERLGATLGELEVQRAAHTTAVEAAKARLLELAEELQIATVRVLRGDSAMASKFKEDVEAEIGEVEQTIADAAEALHMLEVIEPTLRSKLARVRNREFFEAFDPLVAKIISQSSQLGDLLLQFESLYSSTLAVGDELNRLAFEAVPANAKFRHEWGSGANAVFTSRLAGADGQTVVEVQEFRQFASLGKFVECRMDLLRSMIETHLNR